MGVSGLLHVFATRQYFHRYDCHRANLQCWFTTYSAFPLQTPAIIDQGMLLQIGTTSMIQAREGYMGRKKPLQNDRGSNSGQ